MKNDRYIGSVSDLKEPLNKTDSHDVYSCPYCDTIHGKTRDEEGKLYYSPKKNIGFCFRCESVVLNKDSLFSREHLISLLENNEEENLLENINKYDKQNLDLSWTTCALENEIVRDYIKSRGISEDTIKEFNVRACNTPKIGVVFIDKLEHGITNFFQIRNITKNKYHRHLFLKGAIKPVSWLWKINPDKPVILCEGFASALSAYEHLDKDVYPVVATGKTITKFQLHLFSEVSKNVKEITICYDGGFVKEAMKSAKSIYNFGFTIFIMNLPLDKDPNDVDKETFLESFNKRVLYSPLKETFLSNILSQN